MEKLFYLAQVIGGLHSLFVILLAFSAGVAILITIGILVNTYCYDIAINEEENKELYKWALRLWRIALITVIGSVFTPSKETFLFMAGGEVIDKIVEQNPEVKEIPGNTIDLLNEYIKAQTDNVKTKHKTD